MTDTTTTTTTGSIDPGTAAFQAALATFVATIATREIGKAVAGTLSCRHVSVIAELLRAHGHGDLTEGWLIEHSLEGLEDEFDRHVGYGDDAEPNRCL